MDEKFKLGGPCRGLCAKGCGRQDKQLNTYDYLADIPGNAEATDLVEVQFKNTRKGYYHNHNRLPLEKGDIVAVLKKHKGKLSVTFYGYISHLELVRLRLREQGWE